MTGKKKSKGKRIAAWIGGIVAALLMIVLVGGWVMFGTFISAANTVQKLEDGLYCMEYTGDYGFDQFLKQGGAASDAAVADYLTKFLSHGFYKGENKMQTGAFGCSTICLTNGRGDTFFGRNFDWGACQTIIVHTKPSDGYESVSTCNLDFLGFGEDYRPDGSMMDKMQALAAIYVPVDGMNEKGLMIADLMAGDQEETHQQTDKADLTTTTAIRLLLDRAATVDEAIALLRQYDMHSSMASAHHFSIADAAGKSVVVEYVNGEMLVTETKAVTNHYLCESEKQGVGSRQSHIRFDTLTAWDGTANEAAVKSLLESVAQKNYPQGDGSYEKTMWSIVYIPKECRAEFFFAENYDAGYPLRLRDQAGFVKR